MHPKPTTSLSLVTYTCARCGIVFECRKKHRAQHAVYCSRACHHAARGAHLWRACDVCGTTYKARPRDAERNSRGYCSVACRHAGARTRQMVPCARCGKLSERKPCELSGPGRVYCSRDCCWADQRGKPARRAHTRRAAVQYRNGYRFLYLPEHPNAPVDGYIAEHRLVMSVVLGRPLAQDECVHHLSGDPLDNRPENLQVLSPSAHAQRHRDQERTSRAWASWGSCRECGTTERRHAAHGLCLRCYGRRKQREYTLARRLKA